MLQKLCIIPPSVKIPPPYKGDNPPPFEKTEMQTLSTYSPIL